MRNVIVYDMDGVLIDSTLAHAEAFNFAFEEWGLPRQKPWAIAKLFGPPSDVLVRLIFPDISPRKLEGVVNSKTKFLFEETIKLVKVIYGVEDSLREVKRKYSVAVISNSRHKEILALLEAGEVDANLFDAIIGANDIKNRKPAPDAIYAVEKVLKSRVKYVVGDQVLDVQMGKAAGKQTIAVLSGIDSFAKLHASKPDAIVQNVTLVSDIALGRL